MDTGSYHHSVQLCRHVCCKHAVIQCYVSVSGQMMGVPLCHSDMLTGLSVLSGGEPLLLQPSVNLNLITCSLCPHIGNHISACNVRSTLVSFTVHGIDGIDMKEDPLLFFPSKRPTLFDITVVGCSVFV